MTARSTSRRRFLQGAALFGAATYLPMRARAQTGPRPAAVTLPARGEFVIRGATVLTMDPAVPDLASGDVHVRGGVIVAVLETSPQAPADIDALIV